MKAHHIFARRTICIIFASLLLIGPQIYTPSYAQSDEPELFLVAQKAFEDGFYDVAMRYIDQLLREFPQTQKRIQANLLLGQCYFFKNQYLKAYDTFHELLQYNEFKDATLFWLGETYLKGTDYGQAEQHYKQLIELYPNSVYTPQAHYSLGWGYFEQENYKKAKKTFLTLINSYPNHQLTEDAAFKLGETDYNLKAYENTIEYFKNYVLKYPQSTRHAEAYFYIAESHYYLNNPLAAVTYYAKTAETSYDNKLTLMARISLGWAYLKLEKYKLSQQRFDEALNFANTKGILSDDVFLGQASLYSEMKEYEKSLEAYEELIKKFPNSQRIAEAYLGKANTQYVLKNYASAIETYKLIIDRFNNNPKEREIFEKAYFGLAWAYLKSGDIDASIKHFEAIKHQTKNDIVKVSALTQIGDAYQDVEQYQKAIDVYDEILQDYPDSPYIDYVQYRQGIALLRLDKTAAATLSFQSLQVNFPKSKYLSDVKYYLAVTYFKKGDWLTAREYIDQFINDVSANSMFLAEANYILGLSNFHLKNYDEAIKIFYQILKNFPQSATVIKNSEFNIAKCHYRVGNLKESLKQFQILINKYPNSEVAQDALIWLGDHHLGTSEFDTAIAYYSQFIKDYPNSPQINAVYYELGQAYLSKEQYTESIEAFNRIDDLIHDRELYAKAKLAIADILSTKIDSVSAIETYENIIKTVPEFKRDALIHLAEVHKKNKNFRKAIESYRASIKTNNGFSQIPNANIQFLIADTYELLNESQKATDEYLKIPYLYPENTAWIIKAYLRTARIFEDEEKWDQAKIIYTKVMEYNTDELIFAQERLEWISKNVIQ